jgi:hypothetical protein
MFNTTTLSEMFNQEVGRQLVLEETNRKLQLKIDVKKRFTK